MNWLLVALGAGAGGMLRYALALYFSTSGQVFPFGTLLANCLGGFGMGVFLALGTGASVELRILFAVGFLGGLTTFSTFSAETFQLIQQGKWFVGSLHVMAHVIGAFLMTALGYALFQSTNR